MVTEYTTVFDDASGSVTEKKSRFLAVIHHVESEDEALEYINSVKKTYWDARHNCYAYVIGTEQPVERANDDGEPSRTAGLPILESIKAEGLTNVCIIVTRYFGGILLGTGPLAKAYRDAACDAIRNAEQMIMRCMKNIHFTVDYDSYGKMRYEAERLGLNVLSTDYSDKVALRMALDPQQLTHMTEFVNDISRGEGIITDDGIIWTQEKRPID